MSLQKAITRRTPDPAKRTLLSDVIEMKHMTNGDSLSINYLGVLEINKVPGCFLKITKLDISHNRITSLGFIAQFKFLTHLNVANNEIRNVSEFSRIGNKETLVVLAARGNYCESHPDFINLILIVLPRLVEIDGLKINSQIREDLGEGLKLSNCVIEFLCKNDKILQELEESVKNTRLELDLLQKTQDNSEYTAGPYWNEINARHFKELRIFNRLPRVHRRANTNLIRPADITEFIESTKKILHCDAECCNDQERIYKWLFCEILLNLHDIGSHGLQLYLQKQIHAEDLNQCFENEFELFKSLAIREKTLRPFSDIFPHFDQEEQKRYEAIVSINESNPNWTTFPIFSCNSDYLKALLMVLEKQIEHIEDLQQVKEELLSLDAKQLKLQSYSKRPGHYSDEFPQGNRASSRTTIKQQGSPNALCLSPDKSCKKHSRVSSTDFCKDEITDEEMTKKKIEDKIREEFELKFQLKLKEEKKRLEEEAEKLEEERKRLESKKNSKKIEGSNGEIGENNGKVVTKIKKDGRKKDLKAEKFYRTQKLRGIFTAWKNYLMSRQTKKNLKKLKRKKILCQPEVKTKSKTLKNSNKSIKKLTKDVKKSKKTLRNICECGGLNCATCTKEKARIIKEELLYLQHKISLSKIH